MPASSERGACYLLSERWHSALCEQYREQAIGARIALAKRGLRRRVAGESPSFRVPQEAPHPTFGGAATPALGNRRKTGCAPRLSRMFDRWKPLRSYIVPFNASEIFYEDSAASP